MINKGISTFPPHNLRGVDMTSDQIYLSRPFIGQEELEAVREVFESKYLTEGPKTREFERKFAEYVGVRHGIATTSCTSGIEVCLRALGVGPGDEVIVPDFTFPATGLAVLGLGATPKLVDVSPKDFLLDPSRLSTHVTKKTKCILAVSNLGFPLEYAALMDFAEENGIPVVEDAACSTGTIVNGRKVGSMVDVAVFSFHARKVITTGEGGMICTNDDKIAGNSRSIKNFGVTGSEGSRQLFGQWGTNLKMSNICAAIGLAQLQRLENIVQKRAQCAERYDRLLRDTSAVRPVKLGNGVRYNHYCYPLLVDRNERDGLIASLRERKIEAQICSYALHRQQHFQSTFGQNDCSDGLFPNSTRGFECLIQLPLHHELTGNQQEHICNTFLDLVKS